MWSGVEGVAGALATVRRAPARQPLRLRDEARGFADAREVAERAAAQAGPDRVVKLGQWWARWVPVQDLAPSTLEAYAQQYRRYIAPRFAPVPIAQVTGLDLAGFACDLRGGRLAPPSVTVVLSVLRDLLGDAAAEGVIPSALAMPSRDRHRHMPATARVGLAIDPLGSWPPDTDRTTLRWGSLRPPSPRP
jgi:hypothetical protein